MTYLFFPNQLRDKVRFYNYNATRPEEPDSKFSVLEKEVDTALLCNGCHVGLNQSPVDLSRLHTDLWPVYEALFRAIRRLYCRSLMKVKVLLSQWRFQFFNGCRDALS